MLKKEAINKLDDILALCEVEFDQIVPAKIEEELYNLIDELVIEDEDDEN